MKNYPIEHDFLRFQSKKLINELLQDMVNQIEQQKQLIDEGKKE